MNEYVSRLSKEGLSIFLFHGVIERDDYKVRNYIRKHLERDYFVRLMEELKSNGTAVSMDDVVAHNVSGRAYPPNAFAITFDDGFENNYSVVAPIMKELNIPTTFYVATQFVEKNSMPWTDRAEYCLEKAARGTVRLPWEDEDRKFGEGAEAIEIMKAVRTKIKNDASINPDEFVSNLYSQCGIDEIFESSDPLDQKLSFDQVRELVEDDLFIVGGHSHQHKILTFMTQEEMEDDIDTGLRLMKERSNHVPIHYSYPEGVGHCYSDAVADVLKARGIVCCPTAEDGVNTPATDLFHLKRTAVPLDSVLLLSTSDILKKELTTK